MSRIIDVLRAVDRKDIADMLIKEHNKYFSDKEKTLEVLDKFFEDIDNIESQGLKQEEDYEDFLIIIDKIYDDMNYKDMNTYDISETEENLHLDINSVTENDMSGYFIVDGVHTMELKERHKTLDLTWEEYRNLGDNFGKAYITNWGIDFVPRAIILNCEVNNISIQEYGLVRCATELFWEMTFWGLTDELVQKEAEKIENPDKDEDLEDWDELYEGIDDEPEVPKNPHPANVAFVEAYDKIVAETNHNHLFAFLKKVYESII